MSFTNIDSICLYLMFELLIHHLISSNNVQHICPPFFGVQIICCGNFEYSYSLVLPGCTAINNGTISSWHLNYKRRKLLFTVHYQSNSQYFHHLCLCFNALTEAWELVKSNRKSLNRALLFVS